MARVFKSSEYILNGYDAKNKLWVLSVRPESNLAREVTCIASATYFDVYNGQAYNLGADGKRILTLYSKMMEKASDGRKLDIPQSKGAKKKQMG